LFLGKAVLLPFVLPQLLRPPHHLLADVALAMLGALVPPQHVQLDKLLGAASALEGLLVRVPPQVLLQVVRPGEADPARPTLVLPVVGVADLVVLQPAVAAKLPVALAALVRFFPRVQPLVLLQRLLVRERLVADLTHRRLVVPALVVLQSRLPGELRPADVAPEPGRVRVLVFVVVELQFGGELAVAVGKVARDVRLGRVRGGLVAGQVSVEFEFGVVAVAADGTEVVGDVGLEVAEVVRSGAERFFADFAGGVFGRGLRFFHHRLIFLVLGDLFEQRQYITVGRVRSAKTNMGWVSAQNRDFWTIQVKRKSTSGGPTGNRLTNKFLLYSVLTSFSTNTTRLISSEQAKLLFFLSRFFLHKTSPFLPSSRNPQPSISSCVSSCAPSGTSPG
jgi:hypothetical protein